MEKEFSFRNYFIYILRKWIIVALCVLIGGGIGAYYSLSYKIQYAGIRVSFGKKRRHY